MDTNTSLVQQATYSVTAYVLIGLVGIPMNFLVLALAIANRKQQNGYWILIANITLADAVLLIQAVVFQAPNAQLPLFETSAGCIVGGILTYAGGLVSFISLQQISVNRYAAFYFKDRYDDIYCTRNCTFGVALIWAFSIGVLLPVVDFAMMEEMWVCGFQIPSGAMLIYFVIAISSPSIIGYPLLIWSSSKVWVKLREQSSLVVATSSNVVAHARQLLRLLVVFSLLPLVLDVPMLLAKVITVVFSFEVSPWLLRTLINMFYLNAAVDPFITCACMKPYSTSIKKGFSWLFSRLRGAEKILVGKPVTVKAAASMAPTASRAHQAHALLHIGAADNPEILPGVAN